MNINPNNMSPEKLNMLLNMAGKKLGVNPNSLKSSLESGDLKGVMNGMNPEAAQKFNNIVSNPKELEKIMNSPQAQELIKKLMEGNK